MVTRTNSLYPILPDSLVNVAIFRSERFLACLMRDTRLTRRLRVTGLWYAHHVFHAWKMENAIMSIRPTALGLSVTLLSLAVGPHAHAALYAVDAPVATSSIGFSGIVDTSADTFTLTSVVDGAGGQDFWTISAPVVMNAVDSAGLAYDVPNTWDGTIDASWGFLGPLLSASSFNEGSASGTWSDWSTGWGAFMNSGGSIFTSATHNGPLHNWPFTSTNGNGYWITQPGHGAVTVTLVPAPGSAALFGAGALVAVRRRR